METFNAVLLLAIILILFIVRVILGVVLCNLNKEGIRITFIPRYYNNSNIGWTIKLQHYLKFIEITVSLQQFIKNTKLYNKKIQVTDYKVDNYYFEFCKIYGDDSYMILSDYLAINKIGDQIGSSFYLCNVGLLKYFKKIPDKLYIKII